MNILFFLTPKSEVAYVTNEFSLREVLEKMEHYKYSAIPMLDRNGRYVGTITEGDLLRGFKEVNIHEAEKIPITRIPRRLNYTVVNVNAEVESLIKVSTTQNFVPVTDDNDTFIGIVKRSDIIDYCFRRLRQQESESNERE
ncbi:MAG: CBS domain-containing protein [Lachnospiraceae bacterium]|nr:CBS domain-containing protein [Lachnospiraceae bacterium]